MDFVKAFAVIDHDLLLRKLAVYRLSPGTLTLLALFLTDRNQTVHVNASISDVRYLKYGVPQGSVLGQLLFSIYINDFCFYSSKHVANFSQMTQQSTSVILISDSYQNHYRRVSAVC